MECSIHISSATGDPEGPRRAPKRGPKRVIGGSGTPGSRDPWPRIAHLGYPSWGPSGHGMCHVRYQGLLFLVMVLYTALGHPQCRDGHHHPAAPAQEGPKRGPKRGPKGVPGGGVGTLGKGPRAVIGCDLEHFGIYCFIKCSKTGHMTAARARAC